MIEEIDRHVGPSEQKVSVGQGTQAMVLNALGFSNRALYLMPDYLHNKPVDVLIGTGLNAEDFNDDSLGRSLEARYAKGVTEVFAQVAARALRVYRIEHHFVHVDSSSFHLHGQWVYSLSTVRKMPKLLPKSSIREGSFTRQSRKLLPSPNMPGEDVLRLKISQRLLATV